jgi:tetratricopeptide (TPR) repeat protein
LLATIFGIVLALASATTLANKIDESDITAEEWALLPAYCPHTLPYKGYTPVNRAKWEPLMGGWKNFSAMHHYCWALIQFRRAERPSVPSSQKQGLRSMALGDFLYVIKHTDDNLILLPELLTWIGRTQLLLNKPDDANQSFERARSIKPDYWPAYSHWAEFLLKKGRKAEAMTAVKLGLQYAPTSRTLHELFRVLGGKPSDMPKPITQQPDTTAPNEPSGDQTVNTPHTAEETNDNN